MKRCKLCIYNWKNMIYDYKKGYCYMYEEEPKICYSYKYDREINIDLYKMVLQFMDKEIMNLYYKFFPLTDEWLSSVHAIERIKSKIIEISDLRTKEKLKNDRRR